MKAPDTAAGKRVKCPKCGDPVAVPAAAVEYEVVDDDPPTPAKKAPRLIAEDDDPPRPAKTKPKSAPVEVDEAVDDDEEEEDEKPKKKKSKRRTGKNREEEKRKRTLTLILGICGAVFVLGAAGAVIAFAVNMTDPAKATLPTKPAPPPLPAGWSMFNGEGFSVAVPDAIQFKMQELPPNAGGLQGQPPTDAKNYTNGVKPAPGQVVTVYVVSVGTMPPAVKAEFDKSPQAGWEALKKSGGTPRFESEKTIQVGGSEGRQFTLNAGFIAGVIRVVMKGDKIYSWAVMAQAVPAEDSPEVKPFFNTFKVE